MGTTSPLDKRNSLGLLQNSGVIIVHNSIADFIRREEFEDSENNLIRRWKCHLP